MPSRKTSVSLRMLGLFATVLMVTAAASYPLQAQGNSDSKRNNILFTLQDKVIRFDVPSGIGVQVGTATGRISGVSITNFHFDLPTGPPFAFTFDNRAGITDLDGDQIIFKVLGAGNFVAPLVDPTGTPPPPPPAPCPPDQVLCGVGGPVSGTYEVLATSGKYSQLFRVGQKFPFRALGYNPNPLAVVTAPPDPVLIDAPLGAIYVEVYSNEVH